DGIDMLLAALYDKGRYLAMAKPMRLLRDGSAVIVECEINPGPQVMLGDIRLAGLRRTSESFVRRYLAYDDSAMITPALLSSLDASAIAIEAVRYRPPLKVVPRPGFMTADLEMEFVEKAQVRVEGVAGYSPDDDVGMLWSLDAQLHNLFGGGRQILVNSQRRERRRNILDIAYRQPLFLIRTGTLGFRLRTRDYRDEFYEFGVDGSYRIQFTPGFSLGLTTGYKTVRPATNLTSYTRLSLGFLLERRHVDLPLNPSRGYTIDWSIQFLHRQYDDAVTDIPPGENAVDETRTRLLLGYYVPLVGSFVSYLSVSYEGLETSEQAVPLSEQVLIGGPLSLRGYRTDRFPAVRAAWGTVEPRFRFSSGYMFAFYDAAYLNNRLGDVLDIARTIEDYRDSYGIGMSLVDDVRQVVISLGWQREAHFDQPRLSLRIVSRI
ncbi:MAG: BamA/TamA family outer membrane protein, partial [Candidatus Zixiibacteriota bacterium]